jgi:hypothetical protein
MSSHSNFLMKKESFLRKLLSAQCDSSKLDFNSRTDIAESVLDASRFLWEEKAKLSKVANARKNGKVLYVFGIIGLCGVILHHFLDSTNAINFGTMVFGICLVLAYQYSKETDMFDEKVERFSEREKTLLMQWCSTGCSVESYRSLRGFFLAEQNAVSDSNASDEALRQISLLGHEAENEWLNSKYRIYCRSRLTDQYEDDRWEYSMPREII